MTDIKPIADTEGADQAMFDRALQYVIAALEQSGLPFERAPTLYANLISMTLGQCYKEEETAVKALEALIADLRQMVPRHHAQIIEGRKAMIREKLLKAH